MIFLIGQVLGRSILVENEIAQLNTKISLAKIPVYLTVNDRGYVTSVCGKYYKYFELGCAMF